MRRRQFLFTSMLTAASAGLAGLFFSHSARSAGGSFPVTRSDEEWRKILTPDQFSVLRQEGTERPFSSQLNDNKKSGLYHCAGCDTALYSSAAKFDSGTGWPSFTSALAGATATTTDYKLIYPRVEEHCATCGGHLGHVFDDGPPPTGKRHCINGVVLTFREGDVAS
ncbi:peptide-methionine (R)-S-oxide reductase [Aureimonas sp. SA4125]|uniref:peptide-methionine (R)-S-oxide reductase MsrB n=1 Tax=Aureimonas sp. SA4125 TaxID=2826993 RepID=UPI001CC6BC5D|nr:peptide-methionine (R)-S-oxide reductase MsrB [Aureimonas sp. SA4125]BDA87040.1 peptide-methionine (R)-S-oxide reductase [Aureimonas sp. SA4125]